MAKLWRAQVCRRWCLMVKRCVSNVVLRGSHTHMKHTLSGRRCWRVCVCVCLTQSEAESAEQAEQKQLPHLLKALLQRARATALGQLLP